MRSKEVLTIIATWLDKLKIANPVIFVSIILGCYCVIFLINRPDTFEYIFGFQVNSIIEYFRDGLTLYMGMSSGSTFNYLASTNPKKVAALGTVGKDKEKF